MQIGGGNQMSCREGQRRLTAENPGKARLSSWNYWLPVVC